MQHFDKGATHLFRFTTNQNYQLIPLVGYRCRSKPTFFCCFVSFLAHVSVIDCWTDHPPQVKVKVPAAKIERKIFSLCLFHLSGWHISRAEDRENCTKKKKKIASLQMMQMSDPRKCRWSLSSQSLYNKCGCARHPSAVTAALRRGTAFARHAIYIWWWIFSP